MSLIPDNSLRIIFPTPYYEKWHASDYDVVKAYRQTYYKDHGDEDWIEDTRYFVHDPEWNSRFLSIQCAHDGNHPIWKAAHIFARMSVVGFTLGPTANLVL